VSAPADLFHGWTTPKRRERYLRQQIEEVQREAELVRREAPPRKYGD
jgi:hypothetical protein